MRDLNMVAKTELCTVSYGLVCPSVLLPVLPFACFTAHLLAPVLDTLPCTPSTFFSLLTSFPMSTGRVQTLVPLAISLFDTTAHASMAMISIILSQIASIASFLLSGFWLSRSLKQHSSGLLHFLDQCGAILTFLAEVHAMLC
jgi:hypothetical protein